MRLHTGMWATLKMLNTKELSPSQQCDYLCVLGEERNLDASGTSRLFHEGMLEHFWGIAAAPCQAGTGHVQARTFPQQSVMYSEVRNSSPSAYAPPRHFIYVLLIPAACSAHCLHVAIVIIGLLLFFFYSCKKNDIWGHHCL